MYFLIRVPKDQRLLPDPDVYKRQGHNIGTCITALLASVGTSRNAKRTTLLHLMFNVIGTALFLSLIHISHEMGPAAYRQSKGEENHGRHKEQHGYQAEHDSPVSYTHLAVYKRQGPVLHRLKALGYIFCRCRQHHLNLIVNLVNGNGGNTQVVLGSH